MIPEQEFLTRFESLEVTLTEFDHAAHVKLAWAYLQELPLPEAMIHFRDSLKKFIAHHGKSELYHETITFAFLLLIHERVQMMGDGEGHWQQFIEQNPDLFREGKSLLLKFYSEETLASPQAKKSYFLPDRYMRP